MQPPIAANGHSEEEGPTRKRARVGNVGSGDAAGVAGVDEPTRCCTVCCKQRADASQHCISVDASRYKYVVLDIEGTTTPITFVKDVLFPFARDRARGHLQTTWTQPQTVADVQALLDQAAADLQDPAIADKLPCKAAVMSWTSTLQQPMNNVIDTICEYVCWNIATDRKVPALKQLQGHIWASGYASGDLKSIVYDDVPLFFARMVRQGVKVCIYSSGSREAQKLLFKYSNHGDLRHFLSCYFDTKIGHKREAPSYKEIILSLGVDSADQILFLTDIIEEAQASVEAGMHAVLSVRPGNAELPDSHPFPTTSSFQYL
jgi:methylthioribulose 1-phosphate dehydratase / enolase-phosphatase E1